MFVILYFSYNSLTHGKDILPLILCGYYAFSVEYDIEYSSEYFVCLCDCFSCFPFALAVEESSSLKIIPRYHRILASLCSLLFCSRVCLHFLSWAFSSRCVGFPVVASRIGSQSNEIYPLTKFSFIHFE